MSTESEFEDLTSVALDEREQAVAELHYEQAAEMYISTVVGLPRPAVARIIRRLRHRFIMGVLEPGTEVSIISQGHERLYGTVLRRVLPQEMTTTHRRRADGDDWYLVHTPSGEAIFRRDHLAAV